MELWIPITIAAAFLQNLRSALQKHLQGRLGTRGASFVRFGYGFPVAILYVVLLHQIAGFAIPEINWTFAIWAVIGGLAQIFATIMLVHLFSLRNFAVGTAYSKTEPVQAAIFGFILLGEKLTIGAIGAIITGVIGVMLISMARMPLSWKNTVTALASRTALVGIASGAVFGISAVAYRSASLSLDGPNSIMQAAMTLACVTTFQTIFMEGQGRDRHGVEDMALFIAGRPCQRPRLGLLVHRHDAAAGGLCPRARPDRTRLHFHGLVFPLPRADQPY